MRFLTGFCCLFLLFGRRANSHIYTPRKIKVGEAENNFVK